jgi:hypothetical protein
VIGRCAQLGSNQAALCREKQEGEECEWKARGVIARRGSTLVKTVMKGSSARKTSGVVESFPKDLQVGNGNKLTVDQEMNS